jgi:hypothetical protein
MKLTYAKIKTFLQKLNTKQNIFFFLKKPLSKKDYKTHSLNHETKINQYKRN